MSGTKTLQTDPWGDRATPKCKHGKPYPKLPERPWNGTVKQKCAWAKKIIDLTPDDEPRKRKRKIPKAEKQAFYREQYRRKLAAKKEQ